MSKFHGILRFAQDDILKKICEWLLYAFVFLLPWQMRWIIFDPKINGGVWEYGRISVYAFDVVFFITLVLFVISLVKKRNNEKLVIGNWKLAVMFLLLVVINIFIASNKIISIYWWLRILQGLLLVWVLFRINFSKMKLVWSFVISMSLSAILGIYQFLTQSAFASKWLGLAFHSAANLGESVIEFADQRWLRAYGSFPHPNIFGAMCVIAMIFLFWLLCKRKKIQQLEIKKYRNKEIILFIIFIILFTGLFLSFSRAGWMVFLVLSILYLVLCIRKKLLNCYIVKLLILTFLLVMVLFIIYFPLVKTRVLAEQRLEIKSNIQRISGYEESFGIIKNNLWLGVGVGNYTNELQRINLDLESWDYQPVHNIYLLVLSEMGVIGFILICLVIISLMKNEKLKMKNNYWLLVVSCLLLVVFFFDHFWWTLPSGMLIVFLGLGLLNKKSPQNLLSEEIIE